MTEFKQYDTVILISKPAEWFGGPHVGTLGFIDEVHDDNYYTFSAVEFPKGGTPRTIGSGGISGEYLQIDNRLDLRRATDLIIAERKNVYKVSMVKGDEVKRRITELADSHGITYDVAWEIYGEIDRIRDEVHQIR
jgi:hypothetical protein